MPNSLAHIQHCSLKFGRSSKNMYLQVNEDGCHIAETFYYLLGSAWSIQSYVKQNLCWKMYDTFIRFFLLCYFDGKRWYHPRSPWQRKIQTTSSIWLTSSSKICTGHKLTLLFHLQQTYLILHQKQTLLVLHQHLYLWKRIYLVKAILFITLPNNYIILLKKGCM